MFLCLVHAAVNCLFTYPPAGNGCNLKVQISATLKGAGLPLSTSILQRWNFTGNALALLPCSVMGGTGVISYFVVIYVKQVLPSSQSSRRSTEINRKGKNKAKEMKLAAAQKFSFWVMT